MSRTAASFLVFAGLYGLMAVLGAAWATHGFVVPQIEGGENLAASGSQFQMWHALALLGVAAAHEYAPSAQGIARIVGVRALVRLAGIGFIVGVAGFSGGLYATAAGIQSTGVAPFGATALMVGWLLLVLAGIVALFSSR